MALWPTTLLRRATHVASNIRVRVVSTLGMHDAITYS